jgi:hypothetical protein
MQCRLIMEITTFCSMKLSCFSDVHLEKQYNFTEQEVGISVLEVYVRETIQLHGTGGGYFCLRGVRKRNNTTSRNRRWVFLS